MAGEFSAGLNAGFSMGQGMIRNWQAVKAEMQDRAYKIEAEKAMAAHQQKLKEMSEPAMLAQAEYEALLEKEQAGEDVDDQQMRAAAAKASMRSIAYGQQSMELAAQLGASTNPYLQEAGAKQMQFIGQGMGKMAAIMQKYAEADLEMAKQENEREMLERRNELAMGQMERRGELEMEQIEATTQGQIAVERVRQEGRGGKESDPLGRWTKAYEQAQKEAFDRDSQLREIAEGRGLDPEAVKGQWTKDRAMELFDNQLGGRPKEDKGEGEQGSTPEPTPMRPDEADSVRVALQESGMDDEEIQSLQDQLRQLSTDEEMLRKEALPSRGPAGGPDNPPKLSGDERSQALKALSEIQKQKAEISKSIAEIRKGTREQQQSARESTVQQQAKATVKKYSGGSGD